MKNICPQCKTNMREKWIKLHLEQNISIPELAKLAGCHENTLYNWKSNYLRYGLAGLIDKSRAAHCHPNEYSDDIKEKIRSIRLEALAGQKRYLGPEIIALRLKKRYNLLVSPSGIGKYLNKAGLIPPERKRRIPKKERVRMCKIHEPGELTQVDIKYAVKSFQNSWFYQYSAIDWITGVAFGNIFETESNLESILFLKSLIKFYPFKIKGVRTDNDAVFTNRYTGYRRSSDPLNPRLHPFDLLCNELGIKHYLIDPGKPNQNGKVERFHRTCEEEFYQKETFKDLNSLRKKFRDYLYYHNNERENLALGGLTPLEKLKTFPEYENIKVLLP